MLVLAEVEPLALLDLVGLSQVPVSALPTMPKNLFDVAPETLIEGHDPNRVDFEVADVMLP